MRYFIIETRYDTGRKYFRGLSVSTKYAAERDLAKRAGSGLGALAIESYPTVTAAATAVADHNKPLPVFAPRVAA